VYKGGKTTQLRSLVVAHILNFQRDLDVILFIPIELIIRSIGNVDRDEVHVHAVSDIEFLSTYIHTYIYGCTLHVK